jgi:hypothetical protein
MGSCMHRRVVSLAGDTGSDEGASGSCVCSSSLDLTSTAALNVAAAEARMTYFGSTKSSSESYGGAELSRYV